MSSGAIPVQPIPGAPPRGAAPAVEHQMAQTGPLPGVESYFSDITQSAKHTKLPSYSGISSGVMCLPLEGLDAEKYVPGCSVAAVTTLRTRAHTRHRTKAQADSNAARSDRLTGWCNCSVTMRSCHR